MAGKHAWMRRAVRPGLVLIGGAGLALSALVVGAHPGPVTSQVIHGCVVNPTYGAPGPLLVMPNATAACPSGYTAMDWNTVGPQGPVGPVGAAGPAGQSGPQGPAGPLGPPGKDGAAGPQGAQGAPGVMGPAGPQGKDGAAGPQGLAGPQGTAGAAGPQGATGATGPRGISGVQVVIGPPSDPALSKGGPQSQSVATCPTGKTVIGGGYQVIGGPFAAEGIVVVTNGPTADGTGWDFVAVQFPSTFGRNGYRFTAKAICATTS